MSAAKTSGWYHFLVENTSPVQFQTLFTSANSQNVMSEAKNVKIWQNLVFQG
jgi:hypothetical protein